MINARISAENRQGNLKSYQAVYKSFSWAEVEKEFTWHRSGKMNITHEAIDYWADLPDSQNREALIFERGDKVVSLSYAELKSGFIQLNGESVQTVPLSSIIKARGIAEVLKRWISEGSFIVGEPQFTLPDR